MEAAEVEAKFTTYATELIRGYSDAVDRSYSEVRQELDRLGISTAFFPLYGRTVGKDVALAGLFTDRDFYIFFLEEEGVAFKGLVDATTEAEFRSEDWKRNLPFNKASELVRQRLNITQGLPLNDVVDHVGIRDTNAIAWGMDNIREHAYSVGGSFGNEAGARAEAALPSILESAGRAARLTALCERYMRLLGTPMLPQRRGQEFEPLWRDLLEFYGWRPKKIRIPGEENDFTAIYQGLHILGEVRWYNEPMSSAKLREFLAKLDPRPQTIGLFISHSGIDDGARSVIRRAANTKTVVVFGRKEIEQVFVQRVDPGALFDEGLRSAYDYIFEQRDK